jgi:hypothetical protein
MVGPGFLDPVVRQNDVRDELGDICTQFRLTREPARWSEVSFSSAQFPNKVGPCARASSVSESRSGE